MEKLNSYFGMAENDRLFAKGGMRTCEELGVYNSVASISSQSAEKYLKAIVERAFTEDTTELNALLHTHNLRALYRKVVSRYELQVTSKDCVWIGGFYYDTRYPGDNFIVVTKEECEEALTLLDKLKEDTERILTQIQKEKEEEKEKLREVKAFTSE